MKRMRVGGWLSVGAALLFLSGSAALLAGDSSAFSNGPDVLRAQDILVADGYLEEGSFEPGVVDGTTRRALSDYQSEHSLNSRGDLDDETFQMLTSHEAEYPWGEEPAAPRYPVAQAGVVEGVEVVDEADEEEAVEVAETAPIPEPAPAPAEVKEAAVAEPATETDEATPPMPATGSRLPLLALSGLALLGTGALLLKRSA